MNVTPSNEIAQNIKAAMIRLVNSSTLMSFKAKLGRRTNELWLRECKEGIKTT